MSSYCPSSLPRVRREHFRGSIQSMEGTTAVAMPFSPPQDTAELYALILPHSHPPAPTPDRPVSAQSRATPAESHVRTGMPPPLLLPEASLPLSPQGSLKKTGDGPWLLAVGDQQGSLSVGAGPRTPDQRESRSCRSKHWPLSQPGDEQSASPAASTPNAGRQAEIVCGHVGLTVRVHPADTHPRSSAPGSRACPPPEKRA
jgi:hypothetical protein